MIRWDNCKADFGWDGTLRDIYITPATLQDWQTIFPWLCSFPDAVYRVGSEAHPPPADVQALFAPERDFVAMLTVGVGGAGVVFHFFTSDEIECDIDPREVTSQADLDALLTFMHTLANKVQRPIKLTPENTREETIISYDPRTREFEYHPMRESDSARRWIREP